MNFNKKLALAAFGAAMFAGPALAAEGPYTQAQLDKGTSEYNTHCRTCHAAKGKGALGPALSGDVFKKRFGGQSVTDVANWIHENMPQTAPKSLSDEQLYPIVAYILSLNDFTPGQADLTKDSGAAVKIPQ
ncbi:cytochrome c [Methylopila sp. M107]|uniref:c-type cytochrome n=1 Tax=Methylopila sp. M107 TaxID=1101190 RepID=UPI000376AE16|nr:cytochrome c [Methylopila sp. M107]